MILKYIYLILSASFLFFLFTNSTPKRENKLNESYKIYAIDTAMSRIHWVNYHKGYIKFKEGEIITKEKQIINADLAVNMHSIANIDIENKLLNGTLVNVLKSDDFFNIAMFPEAKFELHNIQYLKDDYYLFSGDFIILNEGVCYDFEGKIDFRNDSLFIETKTFGIDRTDWGIFYLSEKNLNPKDEEDGFIVADSIHIKVTIIATLQTH